MDELLTTQEAADRAGVGPTAIKRWADEGLLLCVKTAGGHRRFRGEDLRAFLREHGASSADGPSAWDEWLDDLRRSDSGHEIGARLLRTRGEVGAWYRVASTVGALLAEIGERWRRGELSIMEEHLLTERLARSLARISETLWVSPDAPVALLVTPEGDDHTLGLACAELCFREAGWRTSWAGRATPAKEVEEEVALGKLSLVAVSASEVSASRKHLTRWLAPVRSACEREDVPLVLGGRGNWPEGSGIMTRLTTFEELHAMLMGLGVSRRKKR